VYRTWKHINHWTFQSVSAVRVAYVIERRKSTFTYLYTYILTYLLTYMRGNISSWFVSVDVNYDMHDDCK